MVSSSLLMFGIFSIGIVCGAIALFFIMRIRSRAMVDSAIAGAKSEMQMLQQKALTAEDEAKRIRQEITEVRVRLDEAGRKAAEFEGKYQVNESRIAEQKEQAQARERQLQELNNALGNTKSELSGLESKLESERKQADEKLKLLSEARDQLKTEFQNLANSIFEEKTKNFSEQSKVNLDLMLNPLRDQLGEFRKRVDVVYASEAKDREALSEHIKILTALNQQVSKDTDNLTRALKGENKTQGNWGEMILKRALELSGLKEGAEYDEQVSIVSDDGNRQQPDVIVHLPEGRDIIIDSKVAFVAYERAVSAITDDDREIALTEHLMAVRNHIDQLSDKSYDALPNIRSLDYVLMFMHIEAAFVAAICKDPDLFEYAYRKRVIIVSPSTLLVTLRTIQNMWQSEYQNRNAQEIAKRAADLYDKFAGFVDTLADVKKSINSASEKCDNAIKLLSQGTGNIVRRIESFREMGVKPKKSLPLSMVEAAGVEEEAAP